LIFCADDLINLPIIQFTQSGSQKQLDHLQAVPDEKQILRLTMIANKIYKHYLIYFIFKWSGDLKNNHQTFLISEYTKNSNIQMCLF